MITFLIFVLLSIIGFGTIWFGVWEYEHQIKSLADSYSFEEIDKKIREDKQMIEQTNLKGEMFENILNHLELWIDVKKEKEKLNTDNYEDIVS